jgi:methyl-accepting chemotaxis protein
MTISNKIFAGYAVVLLMFLLVAGGAFYARDLEQSRYQRFIESREIISDSASEMRIAISSQIQHYRGLFLFPTQQQHFIRELDQDSLRFKSAIERLRHALPNDATAEINDINELQRELDRYVHDGIVLVQRGKTPDAVELSEREMMPRARALTEKAEQFRNGHLNLIARERATLGETTDRIVLAVTLLSLLGFGLCVLFSILLTRTIDRQLRETITQLAASSAQILSTTTQVSSGAVETATAVNQTTTTVEEVKQTVKMSTEKAREVSDMAQTTAQVSRSGQQAVEELIEGMDRIRTQTTSTAGTIARLSEQSQAIGEIIATVNDLAEQSNLLAVNASIEAAKAGDHGKGFSVVAQEVKSLAEQSRQATSQIRAILNDIQKATGLAVMATDLSSKAVEDATRQSGAAGSALQLLTQNIENAAQAALQIAASSQQQLVGMDQVALAMENIKQASVQNMAGTKQAEIAAQNLHEIGVRLKAMIES